MARCAAVNDAFQRCRRVAGHEGEHKAGPKGAPLRNIRVPDPLWTDAGAVARELGYGSLSAYLMDALRMLVEDRAIPWDLREP